jgi:hypothetical protein
VHRDRGREIAEYAAQGVAWSNFVIAVGDYGGRSGRLDAPREVAVEIERRLVGLVDIFDREQDGSTADGKAIQHGAKQELTRRAVIEEPAQ